MSWHPTQALAQDVLTDPLSARLASMGITGSADNSNPATIILNPANVVGAPRLYVQGAKLSDTFANGDYWFRCANSGISWRPGQSVALGFDFSYARSQFETDPSPFGSGKHVYDVTALAAGAGFVSDSYDFLVGSAIKRYSESHHGTDFSMIPVNEEAAAIAFDAGVEVRKHATLQGWDVNSALGAAVVNVGNDIDETRGSGHLPRAFNVGANVMMVSPPVEVLAAHVPLLALCVNLDATSPRDNEWEWMIGTELAVAQMFFLRSGLHTYTGDVSPDPALASWGAGVGIPVGRFRARLDYGRRGEALVKYERFEATLEWTL